jgi:acyl-CoA synthetase (AMP-forming)/AMP-acid ligase II
MSDALHWLTLGDVARENRRRLPNALAVVCGETRLTYRQLDDRVIRLAEGLRDKGIGAGDRVLWLGQNCHAVLELLLACSKLGAVLCPANWRQRSGELVRLLADCRPGLVFAQRTEIGDEVEAARLAWPGDATWIYHDDGGYECLLQQDAVDDEVPVPSDAPLLMIYTAAFDGEPRGALLNSTSLIGEALLTCFIEQLRHDDVFVVSGALFHIGCWRYVISMFLLGGANIFVRRVDPRELCEVIDREHATLAYLFPSTQEQIAKANVHGHYDLRSLRSLPGSDAWNAMVTVHSSPWHDNPQRYGQTEVGGIVAAGAFGPPPQGKNGRAAPLVGLRIVDGGREVADGEVGEIAVRGPLVTGGYHDRPQRNAEMVARGWRLTGDLGVRHPDGSITFLGPKARMLKCGAENVYPAEVERAVLTHPEVAQCAIIGVPDRRFDQVVKAVVVLRPGCEPNAAGIIAHTRELIASYKAPKTIEFVDSIPRTDSGVDYACLDAMFGGGNYPGAKHEEGRDRVVRDASNGDT